MLRLDGGKMQLMAHTAVLITATGPFQAQAIFQDGAEAIPVDMRSYVARYVTREDCEVVVEGLGDGVMFGIKKEPCRAIENVDPTPFEIPEDKKGEMPIEAIIEQQVHAFMSEKYGADKFETFKESMDFDLDDSEDVVELSGYEVHDMTDEELVQLVQDKNPSTGSGEPDTPPEPKETPPEGSGEPEN
jgi:hypothetical protein